MSECTHNCSTCASAGSCGQIQKLKTNAKSNVKKVIAVMSGKGGVGKSMVTSLIAAALANKGHRVGVLDADITGPSIPKAFGVEDQEIYGDQDGLIFPAETINGIKVISSNLLVETTTSPIIWRGSMICSMVNQFFTDVIWDELEYLLIDLPPGTGDVPLTVFQQFPVDGVIVVATPQDLVSMIVEKSVNMAHKMDINILGLVENMAYAKCPCCGERIDVFGKAEVLRESAERQGVKILAELPINPDLVRLADGGAIFSYEGEEISGVIKEIESL